MIKELSIIIDDEEEKADEVVISLEVETDVISSEKSELGYNSVATKENHKKGITMSDTDKKILELESKVEALTAERDDAVKKPC